MDLKGIIEPEIILQLETLENGLNIFLCHAHEDKSKVRILYQFLTELGMNPWLDEEKLLPGMEWKPVIVDAISTSDVFMVCLSSNSVQKVGFVQKEIRESLEIAELQPEGKIFIVPVRFDDCVVPAKLSKYQYLDFYTENARQRIISTLTYIKNNVVLRSGQQSSVNTVNLYLGFIDDVTIAIEKSYSRNVILAANWGESGQGQRNMYREFLQIIPYIKDALYSEGLYMAFTNPGKYLFVTSLAGNQLKQKFGTCKSGFYYISKGKLLDFKQFPFAAGPAEILDTLAKINF